LALTDSMRFRVSVADDDPPHIVEAAFDAFKIIEATATVDIADNWKLKAYPNPFSSSISIDFQLDKDVKNVQLKVLNLLGQVLDTKSISNLTASGAWQEGVIQVGEKLQAGIYFIRLESENKMSQVIRIVKN
jgi:hypothetical protein